jgi:heme/copper-type cytochrome/quinol oxidase subunit 2
MNKKITLPALMVLALGLGACTPATTVTPEPMPSSAMEESSSVAPAPTPAPGARTINITVTDFAFTPAMITVKKGEKITLKITGEEGMHGFAIADLGINVSIAPGQTVTVELPTDKAGTFSFRCSIPCGSGHRDMKGTIVVE